MATSATEIAAGRAQTAGEAICQAIELTRQERDRATRLMPLSVRLSRAAGPALAGIAVWAAERLGEIRARAYSRLIQEALDGGGDPSPAASRRLPELAGVGAQDAAVARVLHDSMDPSAADMLDRA